MKSFFKITKWILGQIRPFVLSFIWIIFFGTVLSLSSVLFAVVSKLMIDAAEEGDLSRVAIMGILFIMVVTVKIGAGRVISILSAKTLEILSNCLRTKLFSRILHSQWIDVSKYHSGDIVTRMTRDIGILTNVLVNIVPGIFSLGVQFVGAFIVLMNYEPTLALTTFILGPSGVLLSRIFGRKLKKFHIKLQETESVYRSHIHESIQNLLVVKSFCLENKKIEAVDNIQNERLDWVIKKYRANSGANTVLSGGYWMGYMIAFGWGVYLISKGEASFGTFTAFIQLVGQVQGPFEGIAYSIPQLISASASAERLMELEMFKIEDESKSVPVLRKIEIEFQDVIFKYEPVKPLISQITFKIFPGQITALIGSSGEGKTTIIRLILSLIKPEYGHIYFEGEGNEKIECCPSCRKLVSYVPQGNTLFSGSIRDNLYLGNPKADELELVKALANAAAWEFVEELPLGMETIIGEKGIGLSEGQAQRIAIARALLKKAPILILDEATSALDVDTELKVLASVKGLKYSPTCLIITHRTSAMNMCDRILKLEYGKIIEQSKGFISNQASEAI